MKFESIVIVQARMGSERFPGKTMHTLSGKPSISHLLSSVEQLIDKRKIYIATSRKAEDDIIYEFCQQNNYNVHRGDSLNVASRFWDILSSIKSEYFIRLNADSPLFDYRIIDIAIKQCQSKDIDLVSSVIKRSLPSGTNVEVVNSDTFLRTYNSFSTSDHFEHVTRYFYENLSRFNAIQINYHIDEFNKYKFSFDTIEDKERLEKIFSVLKKPHYDYSLSEKCEIYKDLFLSEKN